MIGRMYGFLGSALVAVLSISFPVSGALGQTLTSELVVSGLARPVFVTAPPGDGSRLFIIEQRDGSTGRVRVFDLTTNTLLPASFLEVFVSTSSEQGLLGLAFHPNFATNRRLFINYTDGGGTTRIREYRASPNDPNVSEAGFLRVIASISQSGNNHNGGWMGFGPDGYLYISSGDGGGGFDPDGAGQNITTLAGSMLRIDVDGDDFPLDSGRNYAIPPTNPFVNQPGADEIFVYGLRNPWRNAFDSVTGDLYIADVGQNRFEEINLIDPNADAGANLGWVPCEGFVNPSTGQPCSLIATQESPVFVYAHQAGRCSITGGEVYRGCAIPELRGTYFYGDFCTGEVFSFNAVDGTVAPVVDRTAELGAPPFQLASFGKDGGGELYMCLLNGEVRRIVAADGSDACEGCPADLDQDGVFTVFDTIEALRRFDAGEPGALSGLEFVNRALPVTPGCLPPDFFSDR